MESKSNSVAQVNSSPSRLDTSKDTKDNNSNFSILSELLNETGSLTSTKQSNNNDMSKQRIEMINRRFNSISEQSIDSTEYCEAQKSTPTFLNSKNFWRSQGGIKKRLSLKLIKKRDTFISKLEEDQKFLNNSGETVELEVILPTSHQAATSKSVSDLQQRIHIIDHQKDIKSSGQNLLLDSPIIDLKNSITIGCNNKHSKTSSNKIEIDLKETNGFLVDDILMRKRPIKFDKSSFKEDLLKSDRNFKKAINSKKKLKLMKEKVIMSSSRDEDSEDEICKTDLIKSNKSNCYSDVRLNQPSKSKNQTQYLKPTEHSVQQYSSNHLTNSNIEMNNYNPTIKIKKNKNRISAKSIPNSPDHVHICDNHEMIKTFISKSFDNSPEPLNQNRTHINPEFYASNSSLKPDYNLLSNPNIFTPSSPNLLNSHINSEILNDEPKAAAYSYLKYYFVSMLQPSDNKLAMKLFGSKKGVLKEKLRQQEVGHWIIHPCSNFRFYWDLVMLILLIANVIILPIAISFLYENMSSAGLLIFNLVSDSMFLLDIAVNFRTGVLQNDYADEIILEPKMIAKHYLRTWFFVDFLSSIPLDYLFLLVRDSGENFQLARTGRALKVLRLMKLLSLLRLLRLSRLVRYIHQWEEFLSIASMVMRILNLVCLIILLAHWNGCLQFLVPMLQSFPKDSWVCLNNLQHADWTEQYTVALFKALSHMLCIGYGRYPPQTYTDMWLTMLSMVTGAMCYAVTIGHVSALVQSFDTSRRMYNDKFKQVEEYMVWRKFPRDMRNRITEYYEHRYQGKMFDEDNILKELSERLRLDIINFNCRSLVSSVPFFANADQNFVSDVVTKLHFEVFQPGDLIIREGTIGNKMYFIQEGIVDIIKTNNEVMTTLSDGSYFGEICLLTKARRVASVQAVTYCNLYSLSVEHFNTVLEQYPMMRRTLESVAAERLNKLGKNPNIISSRKDLKSDRETLKNIVTKASPIPSSRSSSEDAGPRIKQSRSFHLRTISPGLALKKNLSFSNIDRSEINELKNSCGCSINSVNEGGDSNWLNTNTECNDIKPKFII